MSTAADAEDPWDTIDQLAATIEILAEKLESAHAALEHVVGRVDALDAGTAPAPAEPTVAAEALPLHVWVSSWLIPTYELGAVLKDWQHQPALVAELQTLHLAYKAVDPGQPGFDGLSWHGHLVALLDRLTGHAHRHSAATKTSVLDSLAPPTEDAPAGLPFGQMNK